MESGSALSGLAMAHKPCGRRSALGLDTDCRNDIEGNVSQTFPGLIIPVPSPHYHHDTKTRYATTWRVLCFIRSHQNVKGLTNGGIIAGNAVVSHVKHPQTTNRIIAVERGPTHKCSVAHPHLRSLDTSQDAGCTFSEPDA